MKINGLTIGLLVALVILLVYNFRSCNDNGEEIGRLKGIIEEKDVELSEKSEAYEVDKKVHEEKINELNGAIDSANTVIARLEEKDIGKSDKIRELENKYKNLETDTERVNNLEAQVESWKTRFSISQDKIAEKDKIIFSLQDKYQSELNMRVDCEKLLKTFLESQAIRDELIAELNKKLRSKQRASVLERGVGLVVIAALAYGALT